MRKQRWLWTAVTSAALVVGCGGGGTAAGGSASDGEFGGLDGRAAGGGPTVRLQSGTLNSTAVSGSATAITVAAGAKLSGTVRIGVTNPDTGSTLPVVAVPTWGTHSATYWQVSSNSGSRTHDVSVNLTAPTTAGTYYLFFVAAWERTAAQVASCTNWQAGSPSWNDGCDVADWGSSQATAGNRNGYVTVPWRTTSGLQSQEKGCAAITVTVTRPAGGGPTVRLQSGTLNSTAVSGSATAITVAAGAKLSGTVRIGVTNPDTRNTLPVVAVPTWGTHSATYWQVSSNSGSRTHDVSVNLTAPTTAGTYYLFFVAAWERTAAQVASCTNWQAGSPSWNDGCDVADWGSSQATAGNRNGYVAVPWRTTSGLQSQEKGCAAITVTVTRPTGGGGWSDDFESSADGTFPSAWVADGNTDPATNRVVTVQRHSGSKSLQLFGAVRGCWGGIAHRALGVSPPLRISCWVRTGTEAAAGCHPQHSSLMLRSGPSWSGTDQRHLVRLWPDGAVRAGESNARIGNYARATWHRIEVRYERPSASTARVTVLLNGTTLDSTTTAAVTGESGLRYLGIEAPEGSCWYDDVSVSPL